MEKLREIPFREKKPVFNILEKMAEYANLVKDDKWAYWQAMDQIACTEDVMEQRYEEGREEGRVEGREEGIEIGREEGREEERAKAHEKELDSAYNIFKIGVSSLEQIANAMKLDINELSDYIIKKKNEEK